MTVPLAQGKPGDLPSMRDSFERRIALSMAGVLTIGASIVLVSALSAGHWVRVVNLLLIIAFGVFGAILVLQREGKSGFIVLLLGAWIGAVGGLAAGGGASAPIALSFPILLFLAAWLGGGMVIALGTATVAAFAGLTYLGAHELLPVRYDFSPYQALTVQLVVLIGGAVIAYYAANSLLSRIERLNESRRALRASEERYRHLTALSSDWYWEQDRELRFVSTAGRGEDRGGISPIEHVGKRRWELPGTEIVGQSWEEHRRLLEERKSFRDLLLKRTDSAGAVHYVSVSGEPYSDERGAFAGYRGVATDVTQRIRATREARAADERLRQAIEHLNESVAVTDSEDRIIVANRAFRELNHDSALVAAGRHYSEHLRQGIAAGEFPDAVGREAQWLAERLARRQEGGTIEVKRQDGKWLQVTDQRLPDGGMITFGLDITERKRVEDELRANQRLLEQVIDAIPMSIFAKDLDSNYVMANKYMAEFFGVPKEALYHRHTSELPSREATREQSLRDDQWVYRNRRALVHETVIQRPDGTPVPYHSSKIPLFDASGTLTGLLGINRDISEELRAQAKLHASEQLFAAMFHDSPAPLAVVDPDTRRFQDVNRAFTDLFGYTREQVIGHTAAEFGAARPGDERRGLYEALMRDGFVQRKELTTYTASGAKNLTLASGRIIETGGRRIVLFSFSDITELNRAQHQIEEINASLEDRVRERTAQLEAANKELESFSYSVSHDLKSPLRAIDGAVGILRMKYGERLPEGTEAYLSRVSQSARRMGVLIEGLLEFARLSRQALNRRELRPEEIVRLVLQGNDAAIQERGVAVTLGVLPPCHADPLLLRQVFENLISNALKYSSQAQPPAIEIGARKDAGEAAYYVRDNGVGFDMTYANKLFGVFQRLHAPEQFEGTGIGLALVRRIVERHGGRVWAESAPGNGATFYFTIGRPGEG
ncbi:MAG TPA: PAS domain S-box protein [Burkholderiales bacterium]|nr:PAS domain S-box protein [Burkholderiales bacterium]